MWTFTANLGLPKRPVSLKAMTWPRKDGSKDSLGGDGGPCDMRHGLHGHEDKRIPSWVMQRSWSAHLLSQQAWASGKARRLSQMDMHHGPPHHLSWGGSVFGRRGDLRWTIGDHQMGWGQGLTIPRGRTFGTEWHVGDTGLPAAGRLTPSRQTGHHGLLRGLAGEWVRGDCTFGASIGPNHVAAVARYEVSL